MSRIVLPINYHYFNNMRTPKIPILRPSLPPIEEYMKLVEGIWERKQLTNNGTLAKELGAKLKKFLGVKHCILVSSGTLALQLSIKALDLQGEIITSPFSFVATSSAIVWEGLDPVYVDIDPQTFNIDPSLIESTITSKTKAILVPHIYGHPCNVEKIQKIAKKYNLKVIFDAAHAFGVKYQGKSLVNFGDISTLSFHATKIFFTGEGGAIVTSNDKLAARVSKMRDFGIQDCEVVTEIGINAKMSELHAALGLCVLPNVKSNIKKRKIIAAKYDKELKTTSLKKPQIPPKTNQNYLYYPVLFPSQKTLEKTLKNLNDENIFPRRYFFPTLNKLPYLKKKQHCPVAEDIASKVLCLPFSNEINDPTIKKISEIIKWEIS